MKINTPPKSLLYPMLGLLLGIITLHARGQATTGGPKIIELNPLLITDDAQGKVTEISIHLQVEPGAAWQQLEISLASDINRADLHRYYLPFEKDDNGTYITQRGIKYYLFDGGHLLLPLEVPRTLQENCHFIEVTAQEKSGETSTLSTDF